MGDRAPFRDWSRERTDSRARSVCDARDWFIDWRARDSLGGWLPEAARSISVPSATDPFAEGAEDLPDAAHGSVAEALSLLGRAEAIVSKAPPSADRTFALQTIAMWKQRPALSASRLRRVAEEEERALYGEPPPPRRRAPRYRPLDGSAPCLAFENALGEWPE